MFKLKIALKSRMISRNFIYTAFNSYLSNNVGCLRSLTHRCSATSIQNLFVLGVCVFFFSSFLFSVACLKFSFCFYFLLFFSLLFLYNYNFCFSSDLLVLIFFFLQSFKTFFSLTLPLSFVRYICFVYLTWEKKSRRHCYTTNQ